MTTSSRPGDGRPLRFMLLLLGGWIAARILSATLWSGPASSVALAPIEEEPSAVSILVPAALAEDRIASIGPLARYRMIYPPIKGWPKHGPARPSSSSQPPPGRSIAVDLREFTRVATGYSNRHVATEEGPLPKQAAILPLVTAPARAPADETDRWNASAWMLWRDGSAAGGATGPARLGGSQIGARADFDLTPGRRARTSAYARASAALNRPAAPEAALGLAFQPSRALPLQLMAERRIALGPGARNANAILAVGGFGPRAVGAGLEAEGYGQAGMVGFRNRDLFMDGKLSLLRKLKDTPFRLGASLSGGAQPAVSRLDAGPEIQIRLPLQGANARLALEWRERVAGNAAPRSGIALTLATDF